LIAVGRMSLKGSQRFPKTARLRKRAEFLKLSRGGAKLHSASFVILTRNNNHSENRLGVTVSSKVGNAVVRNRVKRRVREYFRRHRAELPQGADILIIARPSAAGASSERIADELRRALTGSGQRRRA
jgi:ribonuclease P protein component